MEKHTKILLGVAGLALLGYLLWEKSTKDATNDATKKGFVNASGKSGQPCKFKMDGGVVNGMLSELDNKYCFSSDGKRGLSL
jgi:hypothetical protein